MFVGTVDVRQVSGSRWMLLAPLTWQGDDWQITVPAWFETDFASIPRALWWLWPTSGAWNPAAIVHDYECRVRCRPCREVHARFGVMLAALKQPWLRRTIFATGVQQFGPTWLTYRLPDGREVGPGGLDGTMPGYAHPHR